MLITHNTEGVFANRTQFFASCHELTVECNQCTYEVGHVPEHYKTRPLATKYRDTELVHAVNKLKITAAVFTIR